MNMMHEFEWFKIWEMPEVCRIKTYVHECVQNQEDNRYDGILTSHQQKDIESEFKGNKIFLICKLYTSFDSIVNRKRMLLLWRN